MEKVLHTKWGKAKIVDGYYRITSTKEGNGNKRLHRLIARDYFGDWIDDPNDYYVIHHRDHNPLNNCVLNLEPVTKSEHKYIHNVLDNPMKGKCGKNSPHFKDYARITKDECRNGKIIWRIWFNGKRLKRSYDKEKLRKWFLKNYPLEIIKIQEIE